MSERKKITIAICVSLLFHAAVLLIFAISLTTNRTKPPIKKVALRPLNVTLIAAPMPTPPKKKTQPAFVSVDGLHTTKRKPRKADYQSDRNSVAGSKIAGNGHENLPTQAGRRQRALDFERERYAVAHKPRLTVKSSRPEHSKPTPQPKPSPSATPRPTPKPSPTPKKVSDGIAFAHERPTPTPREKPKPTPHFRTSEANVVKEDVPRPNERAAKRDREPTKINGRRFAIGANGLNAVSTPIGRYKQAVIDAVGKRWYQYIEMRKDLLSVGVVHIKFAIARDGHVVSVKTTSNTSNAMLKMYSEQAIIDAKIPPIPGELAPMIMQNGRFLDELDFAINPK